MSERKRLAILILIMIAVSMVVTLVSDFVLYRAAFEQQRARLVETAQSQARLMEAIARFDAARGKRPGDPEGRGADETLGRIIDAHGRYRGASKTGEFTLARLEGDQIIFLLRHRHVDVDNPRPIPLDSNLAEPMRLALTGRSGTIVGLDYRGETVLAAYEPVAVLNLGIVVKIDLAEIRAPFVKAGLIAGGLALIVVLFGSLLFVRITRPIITRLRAHSAQLAAANEQLQREVRERILSEEELRKSREGYREVVEGTDDLIARIDNRGRFIYVNHVSERVFGVDPEACVGMLAAEFVHPEDRKRSRAQFEGWIRDGVRNATLETRQVNRNTGETHDILWTVNLHYDEKGTPATFNCIGRDLTERKKAEAGREIMMVRIQQAQKMEAVASLAGGIAHEFNNALTAILGNIELLRMHSSEPELMEKYIEPVRISSQKMSRLTDQLLAYARGGKYQPRRFSMSEFVKETLPLVEYGIPPRITLETDLPSDLWHVEGDITQMQIALSAPLANALEAIEDRGRIRVGCRNVDVTEEFAAGIPGLSPGTYVCLSVQDDGKGMDETARARIFEPFFSTKFAGRGLGMAAVYGIVKNHGGWISVESEPGGGTTVSIHLPAIETVEPEGERPGIVTAGEASTILLIEDEEMVMAVNRAMLERLGYYILEAKTGEEAVDIARTYQATIDLAILDLKLPDMDGGEIYTLMREARPDLKVLLCSGYSTEGPARELLQAGALGFLQKPFTLADLSERLRDALAP